MPLCVWRGGEALLVLDGGTDDFDMEELGVEVRLEVVLLRTLTQAALHYEVPLRANRRGDHCRNLAQSMDSKLKSPPYKCCAPPQYRYNCMLVAFSG
jgi:hypothetical protein